MKNLKKMHLLSVDACEISQFAGQPLPSRQQQPQQQQGQKLSQNR
jgi:hypothetical protein